MFIFFWAPETFFFSKMCLQLILEIISLIRAKIVKNLAVLSPDQIPDKILAKMLFCHPKNKIHKKTFVMNFNDFFFVTKKLKYLGHYLIWNLIYEYNY